MKLAPFNLLVKEIASLLQQRIIHLIHAPIRIVYDDREESTLLPNDPPILIDTRGALVCPCSVVFRGAMSKTGVADLLPLEYTPNGGDQP